MKKSIFKHSPKHRKQTKLPVRRPQPLHILPAAILQGQKKQSAAIALMLAAGIVVSTAAQHYQLAQAGVPEETTAAADNDDSAAPANGYHFSGLRSSLAELEDNEVEAKFTPAPDKLNLAYFYRDGADTSDTIHSYAGEVYQKLMTKENEYLANIYDEAGVSPLNLAKRLGVSTSRVMGKYNPNAGGQDPNDSSTWYIPSFRNVNISFYNADGEQVNEYSNVKDIMSMASVYCYMHNYLDVDTFEKYCEELYEKSRSYTISIGNVYYDSGCINRTAKEESDDEKKVEDALTALRESLQSVTERSEGILTFDAVSSAESSLSPENQEVLRLSGDNASNAESTEAAESESSTDRLVLGSTEAAALPETAAVSTEAGSVKTESGTAAAETVKAASQAAKKETTAATTADATVKKEMMTAAEAAKAASAATSEAAKKETTTAAETAKKEATTAAAESSNSVLVLGAARRFQKLSSRTAQTASTMELAAQETLADFDGVYYGEPGSYGSAKEYAEARTRQKAQASLTSDILVLGDNGSASTETAAVSTEAVKKESGSAPVESSTSAASAGSTTAAGTGTDRTAASSAATAAVSSTVSAGTTAADSTTAASSSGAASGTTAEADSAEESKHSAVYESSQGMDEINHAQASAASIEETESGSAGTDASEQQIVLGTFTMKQLQSMDENTLRQLIQSSLAAEDETQSANEETDVSSKNYCPGHVDLYVKVTIAGFEDKKGLRSIELTADDQDENEAAKSLSAAVDGKGWNGWTDEMVGYVEALIAQDWFKTYGLSISTINPKQPLTEEEISKYLSSLPENISEARKAVIKYALSSVGKIPYYWGGKASTASYEGNGFGRVVEADYKGRVLRGLDCSGWVQWVYWSAIGNKLHNAGSTATLIGEGQKIKRSELQPGDIVVRTGSDSHVVMFLQWAGNGNMIVIHENSTANNVSVDEVSANYPYYRKLID